MVILIVIISAREKRLNSDAVGRQKEDGGDGGSSH